MNMKITSIILLAVFVGGCSSSQKTPEFEDYLATNIRNDGSKEFYYTVTMSNTGSSKRGGGSKNVSGGMRVSGGSSSNTHGSAGVAVGGGSRGGKGGRGSNRSGPHPDEKISEQLEKKLLATGFCRDGWMETERHIQPPNASVRGECNETATDRDYENFPNTEDNSD